MSDMKPEVSSGRRFNPIWVVPLVAVVIGLYMVVHTKLTEGPEITINFSTAEGLEAGKTRLRYRDVDIGVVESVGLSKSMEDVIVTAKLDRSATDMLRADTRFWVVRARVGAGAISGLGTLLSGAYIQLDPGKGKPGQRIFTGLEVPPLTPADAPGVRLVLYSEDAGSVSSGDAIVYHGFKVGRIESVTFDSKTRQVRYDAFIDAPYNDLVTSSTRFWNVSGIAINATAAGINVVTGSLDTILLGGVAFDNLPGLPTGDKAQSGAIYKLNASYAELEEDPFQYRAYFIMRFTQSLRGLEPGAPVWLRDSGDPKRKLRCTWQVVAPMLASKAKERRRPAEGKDQPTARRLLSAKCTWPTAGPARRRASGMEASSMFIWNRSQRRRTFRVRRGARKARVCSTVLSRLDS